MGGPERISQQHHLGSLTARESIEALADPGSFQEIGELAGNATYDGATLNAFTPADSVMGICRVGGRRVAVSADDATVAGNQSDTNAAYKPGYAQKTALDWKIPFVRILDNVRGSSLEFERAGRNYLYDEDSADEALQLLGAVPVATAIMGPVTGLHASEAALSHFSAGVRDIACASISETGAADTEPGGTGGLTASGVIDNIADTPDAALEQVRRFLSYLPDNVWQVAARTEPSDDRNRRDDRLLSIIPERRNRLYNPRVILDGVLDRDSIFEIGPTYGEACITALARVDGYPVGVMAKNPKSKSVGAMDNDAGLKVIRFIQLCDIFHLPLVYFVDEPGFMVGIEAQETGIVRSGARLTLASVQSRMPYITFMVRQVYGVAGTLFTRAHGMYKHYAWLTANWGGMHIEGGTMAAYRRDIESAPDPKARQAEIEQHLWMLSSPFRSLEAFEVDDLIDPRDTRALLCDFVEAAQPVLATQLGPLTPVSYRP
jgi:acetyl-CoA carboxylase carboxyltransferase component